MPSTVIRRFTYDAGSQTLDVEFVSGRLYRYFAVPEAIAERFAGAFAKGRFFTLRIRDSFCCRELDPSDAESSLT